MLDPEYLTHCTDEVESLFAELEENILVDIARRIAENDYQNTSTAQYQLNRMKAMGIQYDEMQKMLSEKLDITNKKVAEIISESSYSSVDKDNVIFKEAHKEGIIHRFNYDKDGLKEIILQGIASTTGEIKNICKTSAATAQNLFVNYLDQVYLSVSSGAFSQQEAVKAAVNDLSKRGIHWIDYRSGAHRRLDTAVRTALRSGVNQTACRCQDKNFELMGGNLVEVTSHMGARPAHAEWQGKIYWRKEKYKNYRNFEETTGYGKGDGLGGWNCRHSFYPYFEGLSNKSFEHYHLSENKERYELDQEQRYNERKIREWKRRQAVNKAGGIDTTLEARKVREWEQRQKALLRAHPDMKRNYAREVVENKRGVINNKKLKEFYAMDNENVRIKVISKENRIVSKEYETAYVYDQKGNVLLKKKGMAAEVEFTEDELKLMKNAIITHNHPMGTTLSPTDIYMAMECGLQEVRATGIKGTYVLRRNENLHLMPTYEEFLEDYNNVLKGYSKAYFKKFGHKISEQHYQQLIQANGMQDMAQKYGLSYWRELNENK